MVKQITVNGELYEAERIVATDTSLVGYNDGKEVWSFKGISDWSGYVGNLTDFWREGADCSRMQAKIALANVGLLDTVEAFIADPATPITAKIAWQEAYRFSRNSQLFDQLGPALSMTPTQIDDLFRAAQAIEV